MKKTGLFPALAFSTMALWGCSDNSDPSEDAEKRSQPDQEMIEPKKQDCQEEKAGKDENCEKPKKEKKPGMRERYRQTNVSQIAAAEYTDYDIG